MHSQDNQPDARQPVADEQAFQATLGVKSGILAGGWSPDGRMLLSGEHDSILKVWDAGSGQPLLTCGGVGKPIVSCAWSPDGQRLLSNTSDYKLTIWDARSGQPLQTCTGDWETVVGRCSWSPNGQKVLVVADKAVHVWDARSGQQLLSIGHGDWVSDCAWSPDGQKFVSGSSDKTLKVWDALAANACSRRRATRRRSRPARGVAMA